MEPDPDLNLHPGFRRVPCLPRSRDREKRFAGGRAKNADAHLFFISHIVMYVLELVCTRYAAVAIEIYIKMTKVAEKADHSPKYRFAACLTLSLHQQASSEQHCSNSQPMHGWLLLYTAAVVYYSCVLCIAPVVGQLRLKSSYPAHCPSFLVCMIQCQIVAGN